jgi:undecaprenyl-diphosphatase
LQIWEAIVLGIVEGVTEFLPVSSTGHLTITEKLMGIPIDDKGVTAFTAVIQVGAILAAVIYFRNDIVRFVKGLIGGIRPAGRQHEDFRMAVNVIIGSVPIVIVGLAFKDIIEGQLRSMWFVAGGLVVWSIVMTLGDHLGKQTRGESEVTWKDALFIGLAQCIAVIPGVSRSGATISMSLFRGLDRVTATRLSFFLGIPALTGGGILEAATSSKEIAATVGWTSTGIGIVVSFIVAYVSIAWLLRYVAGHTFSAFVYYRVAVGGIIVGLLYTGAITAT